MKRGVKIGAAIALAVGVAGGLLWRHQHPGPRPPFRPPDKEWIMHGSLSLPLREDAEPRQYNMGKFDELDYGMSYEECCEILSRVGGDNRRGIEKAYHYNQYYWVNDDNSYIFARFYDGKLISKSEKGL